MNPQALNRIIMAVSAMELRTRCAVSWFNDKGTCVIYFRDEIYHASGEFSGAILEFVLDPQCVSNGYVAFCRDPEALSAELCTNARRVACRDETWREWVREIGDESISYPDMLRVVAMNAVWYLPQRMYDEEMSA